MSSHEILTGDILPQCEEEYSRIGVDKLLILYNWIDYDREKTIENGVNINVTSLQNEIRIDTKENSITPLVSGQKGIDDVTTYIHSLGFVVVTKTNTNRELLMQLSNGRFIAVVKDRSTGLYELFGRDFGLVCTSISRTSTGQSTSNGYSVSLAISPNCGGKEKSLPKLFDDITVPIPDAGGGEEPEE